MLRAEHCICGTSTAGTGTLTLAACPQPPGGTDLFQAFNAQGLGTSVSIPVSYTIVEYTGSDFQTAVRQEKGVGALTLGASITATTLARTTVQQTATGMSGTATYNTAAPPAITIGTAANVLVFIGASAAELPACSPYFDTTLPTSGTWGAVPVNVGGGIDLGDQIVLLNARDHYHLFEWRVPMLAKRLRINIKVPMATANVAFGRLYAIGVNARPTKLLYDFGTFVGVNVMSSTGMKATSATGSGFYMAAGEYFLDIMTSYSGVSAPEASTFNGQYNTGRLGLGTNSSAGIPLQINASSASTAAGDPANITSLDMVSFNQLFFGINTT